MSLGRGHHLYPTVHCLYRITEDSAVTTFEALKARVRELERQLSRGDRYKCLICMVSRRESRHALGPVACGLGRVSAALGSQRVSLLQ